MDTTHNYQIAQPGRTTAERVLAAVQHCKPRRQPGAGEQYRLNSPLRPGSDSHAFSLRIDDGEHGAWTDFARDESGSLYELADRLGVERPQLRDKTAETTKRAYDGLTDYATAHGADAAVFKAAGWRETFHRGRRALTFPTATGPRWRYLDGERPGFWHEPGYHASWHRLDEALALATTTNQPLVLCNGEPSVVVAQSYEVAATCVTSSGERDLPADLLAELKQRCLGGKILVALDCDAKGRRAAPALVVQLKDAGYDARAVDLGGSGGFDLADFCRLHGSTSVVDLATCASLAKPGGVTPDEIIGRRGLSGPPTSADYLHALRGLGYHFALNRCGDILEVNGRRLDDFTRAQIRTKMRDLAYGSVDAVEDAYMAEALRNVYHPIKDYLLGLSWDGQDHIAAFTSKLSSDDPTVVYASGAQRRLVEVYVRRWLVGAVAKVLEEAQNVMLVLAGGQGLGKSRLVRWLCSGLPDYFLESPINTADKDSDLRLMSKFIWEVGELDATTRKADVSALKAFITRDQVSVRRAYGRYDTVGPALASFIGTVNPGSGFLVDETGNRRFLAVNITGIDWSYEALDVNQIWAQAIALYRAGEPWRLLPEEAAAQTERNKDFEVESLVDGWITKHFDLHAGPGAIMGAEEIVDHLKERDVVLHGSSTSVAMEISKVMKRLGVEKDQRKRNGRNRNVYIGIAPRTGYSTALYNNTVEAVAPPPTPPLAPTPAPTQENTAQQEVLLDGVQLATELASKPTAEAASDDTPTILRGLDVHYLHNRLAANDDVSVRRHLGISRRLDDYDAIVQAVRALSPDAIPRYERPS